MDKFFSLQRLPENLVRLIKFCVFFILFVPLVMNSGYFFPFIVFKNVLFRILVEIAFVAYLVLAHLNPEYRPSFSKIKELNKILLAIVAFFLVSLVAGLAGIGIYSSFWSNYERMGGLFHLLHLILFFFVLINVFKDKKDWYSFFTFSIFASLIMVSLAFAQWLKVPFILASSGGARLTGTIGNATFLAAYLLFNMFFVLYMLAKPQRFNLKLFAWSWLGLDVYLITSSLLSYGNFGDWGSLNLLKAPFLINIVKSPDFFVPLLVFQLVILAVWKFGDRIAHSTKMLLVLVLAFQTFIFYNTQTRGAIIGLAAGIGFLALVSFFTKIDKRIKLAGLVFLILLFVSPFALVAAKDTMLVQGNDTLKRLATISFEDITTQSRLLVWQASYNGWTESPKSFLIGYGPENYYYSLNKYFPVDIYKDQGSQIWFDRAHNIFFEVAVTTGLVGLIAYFSILGAIIYALVKYYKRTGSISSSWLFIGLVIAYFIQNLFVFDTINTEIPFYFFLGYVAFLSMQKSDPEGDNQQISITNPRINYIYLGILVVILAVGVFGINTKTLRANRYLVEAITVQANTLQGVTDSFNLLQKGIDSAIVGRFEARQQMSQYVMGISRNQNIPVDYINSKINTAAIELEKSVKEEPLNVRHHLFFGDFLNNTIGFNKSPQIIISLMDQAIELSPTRPHFYYEKGQAYAFMGDFDNAYTNFKKGEDLASHVLEDRWNVLTLAIVFNREDLAEQSLAAMKKDFGWEPNGVDYKRLINIYSRTGNNEKLIELGLELIKLEPSSDNYAQLAAYYAKVGQNAKAREIAQRVLEIDPNAKADVEKFLDLLNKGELLEDK